MAVKYSNSSLVSYTKISPNKNVTRIHNVYNPTGKITKITIHHMAGNLSIEACGDVFAPSSRKGSSNYGIGSDGRVGLYVDEKHRAWTSSSPDNDYKAVTIEVANDGGESTDWHVSDKAYAKLIDLCVDICKRNGILKLNYTGDSTGNLTRHNMFAATVCPGPYLQSKFNDIAEQVNKRLDSDGSNKIKPTNLLEVDGMFGKATVLASQKYFGTMQDGKVSNQPLSNKRYLEAAVKGAWEFKSFGYRGGSSLVKAMQKEFGAIVDGFFGKNSIMAMQRWLNKKGYNCGAVDGYMGAKSVRAWQMFLNDNLK